MLSLWLSVSAGVSAALASLCVKLAFSSEVMLKSALCKHEWMGKCTYYDQHFTFENLSVRSWIPGVADLAGKVVLLSRIILFGLMLLFNGLMWTLFVKSLRKSSSSAQVMVTNSASNFIFSALSGKVVFGEILSLRWWMGATLIILGLFLINKSRGDPDNTHKNSKQKESTNNDKKIS